MNIIKTTKLIHNVFQYCKNEYEVFVGIVFYKIKNGQLDYKNYIKFDNSEV